jgi:tetratricopeptide (TPR) repeat protein
MIDMKSSDPGLPYPGARPFEYMERDRFFGRSAEAADLADIWRSNRLVILYGQSGSGKTSLLSAGVLPLMAGGKMDVTPLGRFSHGPVFPTAALPPHDTLTLALLRSWSPSEDVARLVGLTVGDYIAGRVERHGGRILAVIDQAEEMLASAGPQHHEGRRLVRELEAAVAAIPQLHLLICVREDALQHLSSMLPTGVRYRLSSLSPENAVKAVAGPVEGKGRSFAPGTAEELVTDLLTTRTGAAEEQDRSIELAQIEPSLLQAVCARLWGSLPAETEVITARHVRRYGGVDAALAAHVGQIFSAVADDYDLPAASLRSWLIRSFTTESGGLRAASMGVSHTAGMPNAMAQALEDQHLLRASSGGDGRRFTLLSRRLVRPLREAANAAPPAGGNADLLGQAKHEIALGHQDMADRYIRRALRTMPGNEWRLRAEANSMLGNLALDRGHPAEAEACYRAAADYFEVARDTGAVASHLAAVGQTLLEQGQVSEAVRELRAAVDRAPRDVTVQIKLGWSLWWFGQGRAAVAVLTGVLDIDGATLEALRARGEILADLGEAGDALRDLKRIEGHEWPATRAARGLALAALGSPDADADIRAAVDDGPRNGPALLYAARAYVLQGDRAAAVELARHALDSTDPLLPAHQRAAAMALIDEPPA